MSKDISNYIEVVAPHTRAGDPATIKAVKEMTACCGGCTVIEGQGVWLDDDGTPVVEPVDKLRWHFPSDKLVEARQLARHVVQGLLDAGEQCVQRSRYYANEGYKSELIYK